MVRDQELKLSKRRRHSITVRAAEVQLSEVFKAAKHSGQSIDLRAFLVQRIDSLVPLRCGVPHLADSFANEQEILRIDVACLDEATGLPKQHPRWMLGESAFSRAGTHCKAMTPLERVDASLPGLYQLGAGGTAVGQSWLSGSAVSCPGRISPSEPHWEELWRSTAGSIRGGAAPLINGQPDKRRLEEWRGGAVFPPTFYKITKNTVHLDRCLFFEIAIH